MFEFLISLFIQKKCFSCQKLWHFFCPKCSGEIREYKPYCYICKKYSDNFFVHNNCHAWFWLTQVIVLTRYRNKWIKKLLRHAKYYNKYSAYEDLICWHEKFFENYIERENSILVPVPMHFLRKWKRWYNQSDVIAQIMSKICKIPVNKTIITRSKYTKQQSHLSQIQRMHNLENAFAAPKTKLDRETVIYLVDDVVSTGSTIATVAACLKEQWFKDVRAIILASD